MLYHKAQDIIKQPMTRDTKQWSPIGRFQ